MKNTANFNKVALALLFLSFGMMVLTTQAQTSTPVKILVPEKMPIRIESARLIKFEDKYLLSYRLINQSGQPLTNIGMTVSVAKPDGQMQIQHMWLKDKLQIVSDYEETIAIPTVIQEGSHIALSIHYAANPTDGWVADLIGLNDALRKYQETGSATLPKAIHRKAK